MAAAGQELTVDGGPDEHCLQVRLGSAPDLEIALAPREEGQPRKIHYIANHNPAARGDQGVGAGDTVAEVAEYESLCS